ncbi:MAG: glycosyltransferase [Candidatus Methylomirabilis oxyfera]|nr:glycosyltransferase [Candidatus Methylomirabilis oxyfera]
MKIVQFVHGYPPEFIGGTETYTQVLSQRLVGRGHAVLVVAGSGSPAPKPSVAWGEDRGVFIARLIGLARRKGLRPSSYDPMADALIRRILGSWRPQFVHLHHWNRLTNNIVAICRELGIPTAVTLHDQWIACSRYHRIRVDEVFCGERAAPCASCVDRDAWQSAGEIERELQLRERTLRQELELTDRLLVPSHAQASFLHAIAGIPPGRLEVLPLGSLRRDLKRADRGEPRPGDGPIKVAYWGYLLPEKGVHLLLEAARYLSKGAAVEWHLYGSAPDRAYEVRLRQLAEGMQVIFHGGYMVRDLQSASLDLAVFPSLCCETYSFVLDEAFQLGLPVVASNRGAFAERLGRAGLLFECGDARDLAVKLGSLLENPMALNRLKHDAAEGKVVSMDDHAGHVEKIYQEAVESVAPGPDPDHGYREIIVHQQQQITDREREIERLLTCIEDLEHAMTGVQYAMAEVQRELDAVEDRLVELEAEPARLVQMVATLEEEREWWRKQTKRLEEDLDRLTRAPLHQLHLLLSRLK